MRYLTVFTYLLFCSTLNHALTLKSDYPPKYVVQKGDCLWSIASRYLKNPWEWKALWHANPNIKKPERLYPGAVLVLDYYQSNPYIRLLSNGTIKLSPSMRPYAIEQAIPPIPLDEIKPFLNESLVLDEDVLSHAPYILAFMGEHMLGGQGDQVYVKGLHPTLKIPPGETIAYSIFRGYKDYVDPVTGELLGFKANLVGYGELVAGGEPAIMLLTNINTGIKKRDKVLINNSPELSMYFEPQTPSTPIFGTIIEMPDAMPTGNTQSALGGVVVINLGARSGIKAGDVLAIYGKTRVVPDPENPLVPVELSRERVGEAMVFRAFTKTCFALIIRSTDAIHILDTVTNP